MNKTAECALRIIMVVFLFWCFLGYEGLGLYLTQSGTPIPWLYGPLPFVFWSMTPIVVAWAAMNCD